jgi:hypothetical protein
MESANGSLLDTRDEDAKAGSPSLPANCLTKRHRAYCGVPRRVPSHLQSPTNWWVQRLRGGGTLIEGIGVWGGVQERCLVVEVFGDATELEALHHAAEDYATCYDQEEVWITTQTVRLQVVRRTT